MKILNYQIPNWEKYQQSNTQKFIRLDNDHLLDPKIQQLSAQQYRVWLTLLCTSGRQVNDGKGSILYSTLHSLSKNRGSNLQVTLSKLLELGLIEIQKERKERKKETTKKVSPKKGIEIPDWFLNFWDNWPKDNAGLKGSRGDAWKNTKKFIENNSQEKAETCMNNYLTFVKNTKPDFPYRLSNFFGQKSYWQDFETVPEKPKGGSSMNSKIGHVSHDADLKTSSNMNSKIGKVEL